MTKLAEITAQGIQSYLDENTGLSEAVLSLAPVETLTAAGAASIWGLTILNSASAAVNLTLGSGEAIGQRKPSSCPKLRTQARSRWRLMSPRTPRCLPSPKWATR